MQVVKVKRWKWRGRRGLGFVTYAFAAIAKREERELGILGWNKIRED